MKPLPHIISNKNRMAGKSKEKYDKEKRKMMKSQKPKHKGPSPAKLAKVAKKAEKKAQRAKKRADKHKQRAEAMFRIQEKQKSHDQLSRSNAGRPVAEIQSESEVESSSGSENVKKPSLITKGSALAAPSSTSDSSEDDGSSSEEDGTEESDNGARSATSKHTVNSTTAKVSNVLLSNGRSASKGKAKSEAMEVDSESSEDSSEDTSDAFGGEESGSEKSGISTPDIALTSNGKAKGTEKRKPPATVSNAAQQFAPNARSGAGSHPVAKMPTALSDDTDDTSADSASEKYRPKKEAHPSVLTKSPASEVPGKHSAGFNAHMQADADDLSDTDDSEDDESTSSEEADTKPGRVFQGSTGATKAAVRKTNATPPTAVENVLSSDDSESEGDSEEDESDSSSESEDITPATSAVGRKRKGDIVTTPVNKKVKNIIGAAVTAPLPSHPGSNMSIFVGGLSWNIDGDWLRSEFEECGEILNARVVTDRDSGKSKGFGYVDFANADGAQKALAKKGTEIDGRAINVDISTPRQPKEGRQSFGNGPSSEGLSEPSNTIFVGNLSFEATEDLVWETFAEYGAIASVRLPTDRDSGRPKGFAYVEYNQLDEATKAVTAAAEGAVDVLGRAVRVDYSGPRPQRPDGASGRGNYAGGRGASRGANRGGFSGSSRGRGSFERAGRGAASRGRGGRSDAGWGSRGGPRTGGIQAGAGKKTTF